MLGRNSFVRQWGIRVPRARRGKIARAANPAAPPHPLSQLFLGIAFLSTGFVVLALTALAGTKLLYPGGYPAPFIPYQALLNLPGTHISEIGRLPCEIINESSCNGELDSEHFGDVEVVSEFETITQVWLTVKSLQVVDVVQRWGPPQRVRQSSQSYIAFWDSGLVAFCALDRRFHYQLEVKSLLFQAV